jgi:hypothetical protein
LVLRRVFPFASLPKKKRLSGNGKTPALTITLIKNIKFILKSASALPVALNKLTDLSLKVMKII